MPFLHDRRILSPGTISAYGAQSDSGSSVITGGWNTYDGSNDGIDYVLESAALSTLGDRIPHIKAEKLDASSFVVAYWLADGGDADEGTINIVVCTVSGTVVTTGTPVEVVDNTDDKLALSLSRVADDKFLVGYQEDANGTVVKSYTVSGTTPTLDATLAVDSDIGAASSQQTTVIAFSSTRGAVTYYNGTSAEVDGFDIGSGSLTLDGTPQTLVGGVESRAGANALVRLSSTTAFCQYATNASSPLHDAVIVTDSGTALSLGTEVTGYRSTAPVNSYSGYLDKFGANDASDRVIYCSEQALGTYSISGTSITLDSATTSVFSPFSPHNFYVLDGSTADIQMLGFMGNPLYSNGPFDARAFAIDDATGKEILIANDAARGIGESGEIIPRAATAYGDIIALSTSKAVAAFRNASGYPTVRVLQP